MTYTAYAKNPLHDSSKALVGYITWNSTTKRVRRYSPDSVCLDAFQGWDEPAEFRGWLAAYSDAWSLDPDQAYFGDMAVDIGL